ncbi:MAG: phosphotransferase [Proteobacteria bacterium]|nr:phosphotransferase [Pseudomonadota bacterium]MDE3207238.1 phosphotransferase [Pseudomonadota bacterium]
MQFNREIKIRDWLDKLFDRRSYTLTPASSDASFRRYFRVAMDDSSYIVMDAPPEFEDCRPFLTVARIFEEAGLHVPKIFSQNLHEGFLLLSDFGTTTYLSILENETAPHLYDLATDTLITLQRASRETVLPGYDKLKLIGEMRLFPEWYLKRHLNLSEKLFQESELENIFCQLAEAADRQAKVFVHRDFHSRNLMMLPDAVGVLDFQDAVYGPVTYDLVSLLKDAYIKWDEEQILDWTIRYWEKARRQRIAVPDDFSVFYRDFEWMGMQRHLKVLGIFSRLSYRDDKHVYLQDIPLVLGYVVQVARRYREFSPLYRLLCDSVT